MNDGQPGLGVLATVEGHVLVITIDRPHVRNAIDLPSAELVSKCLDELDERPELRCGVIAGAGSTFSAGMDLKAVAATQQRPITADRGGFGIVAKPPQKPIIAAVEGHALGGGFEIALACDLIVAAENATFGLPEVRRGQVAGGGGAVRLGRRVPFHVAAELLLTGDSFSARRAAELGLVSSLVAPGTARAAAIDLATRIAENAPLAVQASKRLLYASLDWSSEEAMREQQDVLAPVRSSADAGEGVRAFTEKRKPVWQGR